MSAVGAAILIISVVSFRLSHAAASPRNSLAPEPAVIVNAVSTEQRGKELQLNVLLTNKSEVDVGWVRLLAVCELKQSGNVISVEFADNGNMNGLSVYSTEARIKTERMGRRWWDRKRALMRVIPGVSETAECDVRVLDATPYITEFMQE